MSTNGVEVCEKLEDLIRCYEEKGQTVVLAVDYTILCLVHVL